MRASNLALLLLVFGAWLHAADDKLRVGVVGLVHGHVSGFLNQALKRHDVEVVGIAEPDTALQQRYASRYQLDRKIFSSTIDELIAKSKPDAIVLYTNTFDHRSAVEACARHHVDVMMEKPLAVSYDDAKAMKRAAVSGGIQVLVNYETTWYASNRAVYDLVRDGALGDITKVVVHDGHQGPKEIGVQPEFLHWLTDPKLNGAGALFDFGCYGADLMTWLMKGQRPLTVTAVTQQIKRDIYPNVDDGATLVLTYPKAQAILQASWNWPFDRKDMEVYGRTGYAITVRRDDIRLRKSGEKEEQTKSAKEIAAPEDDSLRYLAAVVRKQIQPSGLSSLETNMIVTRILDAGRQSAKTGRTIKLAGD